MRTERYYAVFRGDEYVTVGKQPAHQCTQRRKGRKNMKFKVGDMVRYKDEHYEGIGKILVDDTEIDGILEIDTDEYGALWFADDEVFSLTSCDDTEKAEGVSTDTTDMVNFPKHYNIGNIQTLDYIDDVLTYNPNLTALDGYYIGNILKYLGTRLGTKNDKLEDMQKAQFYLNRLIEKSDTD